MKVKDIIELVIAVIALFNLMIASIHSKRASDLLKIEHQSNKRSQMNDCPKRIFTRIILLVLLLQTGNGFCQRSFQLNPDKKYYGFINKTGKFVIAPIFQYVGSFSEGLAYAKYGNRYGFIDHEGNFIIEPKYMDPWSFSEGLARVEGDNYKYGYIDKKGNLVIAPMFDGTYAFSEGLAFFKLNGKFGYIDKTGRAVITPHFDDATSFSEGLAVVKVGDEYGYINKTGVFVIEPKYWKAYRFSEGLAAVNNDRGFGYIDRTGKLVIKHQFDQASEFSEGLARVVKKKKTGYINQTGEYVIKPKFNEGFSFSDGIARVKVGNKYGYIDKTGNYIIKPRYDLGLDFSDGLALVEVRNKEGFIDTTGNMIIEPKFKFSWNFKEGLTYVKIDGKTWMEQKDQLAAVGLNLNEYPQVGESPNSAKLFDEIKVVYNEAIIYTNRGAMTLFISDDKLGNTEAAQKEYSKSNSILNEFFSRWKSQYEKWPELFAELELLQANNAHGLAVISLAKGDRTLNLQYMRQTIEMAGLVLKHLESLELDKSQETKVKEQCEQLLADTYIAYGAYYISIKDYTRAKENLDLARQYSHNQKFSDTIDELSKKIK